MKRSISLVATLFFATSFAALAQTGTPAQSQEQVQQQTQQQIQSQQRIYGSQLMTPQERMNYRQRMRQAKTVEECNQIRAEHHKQMQERAKARGITLPDMPPAMRGRMQQRYPGSPCQGGQGQGMRQPVGNGGGN